MVIDLGPFVHKGKLEAQHLSVLVNGTEVASFEVREVSVVECLIPWSVLEGRDLTQVMFRHPDAVKPSDVSSSPDERMLALAFERLELWRESDWGAAKQTDGGIGAGRMAARDLPDDELMMQFESLGENCEFGLAQRRCGAEPLGLLRFASTPLPNLLSGLAHGFAGMGDADQIEVEPSPDGKEYLVIDRRFGFLYHPWVLVHESEPESVLKREMMRLPFLRRKMLEDLREGRKIFVYHGMKSLREAEIVQLFRALRIHGPSTLLWVELAEKGHPAGSVEVLKPGLLKGYINRFAPGENAHDFSLSCWLDICRNAHALAATEISRRSPVDRCGNIV
jgi:hypothetical protein